MGLNLYDGVALGFVATLLISSFMNRFGDLMFRKGVARPFYVLGRRLHHKHFLLIFLPTAYGILSFLILAGYIRIVWNLLWTGLAGTLVVAGVCLVLDLALDYATKTPHGWGIIHHELVYLLIPAYAFTDFLKIVI